jgi:type II secretory pathway pseudopilin PulG
MNSNHPTGKTDNRDRGLAASMAASMAAAGGFTLIELMAVVLIMVLMVTIGMLALPGLSRAMAVNRGAAQIVNAYEYARQTAITTHSPTRAVLGTAGYSLFQWVRVFTYNADYRSVYRGVTNTWQVTWPYSHGYQEGAETSEGGGLPEGCGFPHGNYYPTTRGSTYLFPWSNKAVSFNSLSTPMVRTYGKSGAWVSLLATNSAGGSNMLWTTIPTKNQTAVMQDIVWVEFNPFGQADITTTVTVYEATVVQQGREVGGQNLSVNTNSANWVSIITQAGSGRIRTERPGQ